MKKFWMVIKKEGYGSEKTGKRHYSRDEADREAERLCQDTGEDFIVLEAIMGVTYPRIPLAWYHIKD